MSRMKRVLIDPAGGGPVSGALGPNGMKEAVVALDVALRLAMLLHGSVEARLTRKADTGLGHGDRVLEANTWRPDAMVRVRTGGGAAGLSLVGETDRERDLVSRVRCPVVFWSCGQLVTVDDEARLSDPEVRQELAEDLALELDSYLGELPEAQEDPAERGREERRKLLVERADRLMREAQETYREAMNQ